MPFILSAVLGILTGSVFRYFPFLSLFTISIPFVFFILKRKYTSAFCCLILSLAGLFYNTSGRTDISFGNDVFSFQGYVVSKKENLYIFKTSEGKTVKAYSNTEMSDNRYYRIECKKISEHKNPYIPGSKNITCYVIKAEDEGELNQSFIEKIQLKINRILKTKLDENTANVLIAMTTGYRYEISGKILQDFQKTGLIHLLSISGAHFSLLFTVSFFLFRFILKHLPYNLIVYLTLYIKPSQLGILLCFPVLFGYFLIVQPNYPSTRAFLMATLFMLGVLTERKSIWIITLSIACFLILILDPEAATDLSFQLSFLATAGIGFVTDIYKSYFIKNKGNKILCYLILSLLISLSATLITAPMVAYRFHYLSIISPLSNLTAGLILGGLLFPLNILFIALYLISGIYPFPDLINSTAGVSFWLMNKLSSFEFSSISISAIPPGVVAIFYLSIFAGIFSFYIMKGNIKKFFYGFSVLLIFFGIFLLFVLTKDDKNSVKITFLDTGQADSTVIETPQGVFLVDTGRTGFEAEHFLKAKSVKELNAIIITHEQKDHAGGLKKIKEIFNVKEIWDNGYIIYNIENQSPIRHLERGDVLKAGNCEFSILHPYKEFYVPSLSKDSNELSMIFGFRCFKNKYLFTSDAGTQALQSIPVKYLKSDIVKVPHHGSRYSFFEGFYEFASPKICIISAGVGNPYRHPHPEVVEYLKTTCRVYRTDIDGAIQIKEFPDGELHIKTFEDSKLKPYRELENLKKLFILW
uniref:DNA internalization-related competence protein ComEC/Rec2 n=1 Tax=Thermodesulfovibrio aggregans TaxID=86166 RepID=A0A7C4EKM2_9BACT